jgi:hypothetical protein
MASLGDRVVNFPTRVYDNAARPRGVARRGDEAHDVKPEVEAFDCR